jgi:NADH-quinone oxidoreductase subunit N
VNSDIPAALSGYFAWIIPECILGAFACVLFLGATWRRDRNLWGAVALIGIAAAGVALWLTRLPVFESDDRARAALFASPVWLDHLAVYVKALALGGVGILVLLSWESVDEDVAAEHHGCLLVIAAGVCFSGSANDLITLFLALELISIPTYITLYLTRGGDQAREASVKYFLLSVFSSAMLLFGFSYLYGLAGTTNLHGIADAFTLPQPGVNSGEANPKSGIALVALVMIVAGLGFRLAAVPFHFYAPDVYQGTSNSAAALLAYVPKVAGVVALIRVFGYIPFQIGADAQPLRPIEGRDLSTLLWIIAAVTMTLGNILALLQDNVRRMLAYSSVAHSGYMLIGLAAANYLGELPKDQGPITRGVDTVLFYLVAYGVMTIGAFAVLEYLTTRERSVESVDDLAGLSKTHPGVALVMTLFLLSLIGIPPTPGFTGKWELLFGAFSLPTDSADAQKQATLFRILALIGVINAAIGSWYYLRLITVMYLRTPLQPIPKRRASPELVSVWACAALLLLFCYPRPLFDHARRAIDGKVNTANSAQAEASPPGGPQ